MRCLACDNTKLETTNSRKHPRETRVWRRRHCTTCGLTFTTHELPEYSGGFVIIRGRRKRDRRPFSHAGLLRELFTAGGHVKRQDDLVWLAQTAAARAMRVAAARQFTLPADEYVAIVMATLAAYDELLAANYKARL
ncbi:hypothetical protein JNJ66_05965 [Candidatus Saccharibacteria bacterium]|nr:hypothetical protein [Candidatus Saccharibacteria bacterium]